MKQIWLAALAFVLAPPAFAEPFAPPAPGTVTVYRDVQLIDGTGAAARPGMSVVVDGQRIRAVVATRDLVVTRGAEVIDLHGAWMLPGLIDSHVHLRAPDRRAGEAILAANLYGGVTAVRDPGDDLRGVAPLSRDARQGVIAGSDVYYAALMGGPLLFENPRFGALSRGVTAGTAPWARAVDETTDLAAAVSEAKATGATGIKIYSALSAQMVEAITAEAHRQGLKAWAHAAVMPARPSAGISAGVDTVSHVCDLAYEVSDVLPPVITERAPVALEKFQSGEPAAMTVLFTEMHRKSVVLDATGRVYVEEDKRTDRKPFCTADLAARLTADALRAGVEVSAGTDGISGAGAAFPALYDELDFLADRVGMSPLLVIRSATLISARAAGQEADMGTIEPGKLANFVIVEKSPLENLKNLRTLTLIVKRGVRFARADYRPDR